jgi:hypothetical protein
MVFLDEPPRNRSFILRLWEARSQSTEEPSTWRFSLQDPESDKRYGFADLEALVEFLRVEIGHEAKPPASPSLG